VVIKKNPAIVLKDGTSEDSAVDQVSLVLSVPPKLAGLVRIF
jgi:hypothetical protein